jgi:hypothetical protein
VVSVKAPEVYVVAVFAISVQELYGETELCHLTIVPVFPESESKLLILPVQIVVPPVTLPPTEGGLTVTVVEPELAEAQLPL